MEIGSDSDSGGSHVSATPPGSPIPRPRCPAPPSQSTAAAVVPPPAPLSIPRLKPTTTPKTKPRPSPKPKTKRKAPSVAEPPPPPLAPADFSSLPGLSIKIRNASFPEQACPSSFSSSFASLVKSRRSSFDPSEFEKDGARDGHCGGRSVTVDKGEPPSATDTPAVSRGNGESNRDRVVKTLPNWIGRIAAEPVEQPKRLKFSNEGNFVRLNINGYGRKYSFRNGKRNMSSRGSRYRRRWSRAKPRGGAGGGEENGVVEEDGLVSETPLKTKETDFVRDLIDQAVAAARSHPSDQNLKKLLKLTHGYDSFRDGQLDAIKRVLSRQSTMLVLPTGAGKSLCYQLPALILPGLVLVVSPLVALMVDQLQKLPPMIQGALLCSSQSSEEATEILDQVHGGSIKVLYVSPERFSNADFLSVFGNASCISLVVIDEAHCISEWSHNFRPSYLRLRASMFQTLLHADCYLAMTATATFQTLHDIMTALDIEPNNVIKSCQIRDNLQLNVTWSENRLKDLLLLMKSSPLKEVKSIIVYCKFQSESDIISKYLCDNNISSKSYHSGIQAKDRARIQEQFCNNRIKVVVATVAFGMGLDKSDVGAVIHYSLPESLESYVQETGRAGRDGRLSYCHLLLDESTYYKLRSFLYSDGIDEYAVNRLLGEIFENDAHTPGKLCSLVKESASRRFDMKEEVILTILTQLELGEDQYVILYPPLNVTYSVYFHKTSPSLLGNKDALVAAILEKSETRQGHYVFDMPTIANYVQMEAAEILLQLQTLKFSGEITYDVKDLAFCFKMVKKPADICSLTEWITKWLAGVLRHKVWKLDTMFDIAIHAAKRCKKQDGCLGSLHTACLQSKILDYFCCNQDITQNDISQMKGSSPFLRADIKVFLQSNSSVKFNPRAVARIMHGIPSPAFPSANWSKCHFWGRYSEIEFSVIMEIATEELMRLVEKGP